MTDRISFINIDVRPKNKTITHAGRQFFIPRFGCGLDRTSNSVDVETPVTCQMIGSTTPNFTSRLVKVAQEDDTFCIAGTSTSGDFMYVNTNTPDGQLKFVPDKTLDTCTRFKLQSGMLTVVSPENSVSTVCGIEGNLQTVAQQLIDDNTFRPTPKTVRCDIPYPERGEDMVDLPFLHEVS